MAHKSLLNLVAESFVGDADETLNSADVPAFLKNLVGRWLLAFEDTDEAVAFSSSFIMPQGDGGYSGGSGAVLKVDLVLSGNDTSPQEVRVEVYVEAITPDSDSIDMEAAASWSSVNATTLTMPATAGYPQKLTITLTNDDGVQPGDLVRLALRRNTSHADDDATGDLNLHSLELWEDTG
jgi:hypothetical protein